MINRAPDKGPHPAAPVARQVVDLYILLSEDPRAAPRPVAEEIKLAKLAVWETLARRQGSVTLSLCTTAHHFIPGSITY